MLEGVSGGKRNQHQRINKRTVKNYVISLGGSLIVPDDVDTAYLKKFFKFLTALRGRIFVVCGGGALARRYISALRRSGSRAEASDLDRIGIWATKVNAHLLSLILGKNLSQVLPDDPGAKVKDLKKVNISHGWKPGCSTDYIAARIAKTYNARTIINLTDVDYVYSADPKKNRNAKPKFQMSWAEYFRQFGRSWSPGGKFPFDPVAAVFASHNNIKVAIVNGKNLANLKRFLSGKSFRGTILS